MFQNRSWQPTLRNTLVMLPSELPDMLVIRYWFCHRKSWVISMGWSLTGMLKCQGSFVTYLRMPLPSKECLLCLFLPLHPLNSRGQTRLWSSFRECPPPSFYEYVFTSPTRSLISKGFKSFVQNFIFLEPRLSKVEQTQASMCIISMEHVEVMSLEAPLSSCEYQADSVSSPESYKLKNGYNNNISYSRFSRV